MLQGQGRGSGNKPYLGVRGAGEDIRGKYSVRRKLMYGGTSRMETPKITIDSFYKRKENPGTKRPS